MIQAVRLQGLGVSPGVAVGPVLRMVREIPEPAPSGAPPADVEAETRRALVELEAVAADLEARGVRAGGEAEAVLVAQAMMARDPGLAEAVTQRVAEGRAAPRAVFEAFGGYRDMLAGAGDYISKRVADLDDVRDRTVARLLGLPMPGLPATSTPSVLVARDLAPADTANLDPALTLGLLTEEGGPTSHTAILARTSGIPAVVACPGAMSLADGTRIILDGGTGLVRVEPGEAEVGKARAGEAARSAALASVTGPGSTADGRRIPLLANIGGPADLEAALANGAEGVGLYRTEFLFLDRQEAPSEAEQEAAYAAALAAFPSGKVVVRVLDAGADKPLGFLAAEGVEPNPALGVRGLRMLQRQPEILESQLRALARAAQVTTSDHLEVMAPMVSDAAEARWFVDACHSAGLTGGIGVMVEVPAAALRAAAIAAEVDFFSIGTNDLTQYAFAADRQVGALSRLQDPWQPALLDLVAFTATAAAAARRGCGVCGEAAADPVLACVLVGLGATSLSMAAPALAAVRAALRRHSVADCQAAAEAARRANSPEQARTRAREALPGLAGLGF
jgi:phosphoenolpyruvate-protein phosphotransferase (PTS system enzyme I)